MNDQNKTRRMDFGAGRRQMSPEMLEAQRRLAQKQRSDRENQATFSHVTRTASARTPSGASYTHTRTTTAYSSVKSTPASRPAPVSNPARPRITPRPASVASGPMTQPSSRPAARPAAYSASKSPKASKITPKMPHKEPSGPVGSASLETLEFDSLDAFGSVIAPEKPVAANNSPKSKKDAKKSKKEEKGPDNAKSILGGKSPFINTLNLEKRPLSGHSVNKKKIAPKIAPTPAKAAPINDNVPTMVSTKRKSRKSNIALAIAIFLTVILGAVVGTFVYLAFFQ
ncbi:hypothetical protein IKD60_02065 [Candidatus Saccharibacteria bacterium]|nr:hypothetical protein [Candidatus Saccharibacteria bacterium]